MTKMFSALLFSGVIGIAVSANSAAAQQQPQQPQAQSQPQPPPQPRNLWIAKFTCDTKAASAVAATQRNDSDALQYSNLFNGVTTFNTSATQPQGTWSLTANEVDFSGGSTAERAIIGWGSGRASITIEYTLTDPSGKAVWTQKIKTKPSFWGASGELGAVQNQGAAVDDQAQKLVDALTKYFGATPPKNRH